jgi:hypothetical protein
MDIDITGTYDPVERQCDITVTVLATDQISYSNLKLRIALTESNIGWQAPNGSYWHHQTFRHMYPSTSGVSFSISEGETFTYEYSFDVNSELVDENCEIVAFVQSDNSHRILQGGKTEVTSLTPFSLIYPEDEEILDTCYPEFTWESTEDPNSGEEVTYTVHIDQDPSFSDPFISDPISDTVWTSEICLITCVTYHWRVLASAVDALDRFSEEVYSLAVIVPADCDYVVGDFNGSGVLNVADIVDGYSKLKTGFPEPGLLCECPGCSGNEWAVAMDVNNSCAFNVADIVDSYSKLKTGLPELVPCESCPPGE